jgi:hypothetical protein
MQNENPNPKTPAGKTTAQPERQRFDGGGYAKSLGQRQGYRNQNHATATGRQVIVPEGIPQVDKSKGQQSFSAYFNPPDSPKTKPVEKSTNE